MKEKIIYTPFEEVKMQTKCSKEKEHTASKLIFDMAVAFTKQNINKIKNKKGK